MSRIAIVGMACLFPGAPDLERFWQNIVNGVDAITEVPASRWDESFYDPESSAVDRFYCRRGGFVDAYAAFDPLAFGVMPKAAAAAEPDQLLTLKVGYEALRDAGYADREFARDKTGVIIGRGNYVTAGVLRLEQHVRLLPQLLQTLKDLFPGLPPEALAAARERLQQEFSYYGPDVAAGMIPNLIASRLANRLDLHGPAYTVDAACASSLLALEQACRMLARSEADMMLVGGAHLTHDLTFWATFCQLGALSRTGTVRPLSAEADGILAGEGVGMVVLKRLEDAQQAGDRIYAVIEGVGSSSDGRSSSLVAPSVSGQRIALERAWAESSLAPATLGLVEAHGTGTPTGDEAELDTLREFFGGHEGKAARAVIGSVKSMIGHTMPAAGMAGLIKTALAIHHGVLPPTLHCEKPNERLEQTRFRVIGSSEPWATERAGRVAAVNAFGFGGINAHVVLRGVEGSETSVAAVPAKRLPDVLVLSAATPEALLQRLEAGERDAVPGAGGCRLVVIAPDDKKLAMARKIVAASKPWQGRQQIYFSPQGLITAGGKLVFMFPGVDSTFAPQAADLAAFFRRPLPRYCETLNPSDSLLKVVLGLLGFNRFLFDIFAELGLKPDAMAGHSVGEWSAMLASGMMDQGLSDRTNDSLDLDAVKFPDVLFLAAACDESRLQEAMAGLERIAISHDNCPHQVIACGQRTSIEVVAGRLKDAAIFHQVLPIVSGFHSPLFSEHMAWYRDFFGSAALREPQTPVWSSTTMARFPADMAGKQRLALEHLLQPVRFRGLVERLYDEGHRVFVQVGTGSLTGFVDDTLSGRPHLAIAANQENRSGLEQLLHVCAALWVEGAQFDTRLLQSPESAAKRPASTGKEMRLSLGVPLVRVNTPLEPALLPYAATGKVGDLKVAANDAVGLLMQETLADIERAGRDVLMLWQQHQEKNKTALRPGAFSHRIRQLLDIQSTIPYVSDHELYPQREGWPVVADRHPVVPMTMEVMLVREAVEAHLPGLRVIEVCDIQAYNWLLVAEPRTVDISLNSVDGIVIDAEIEGYFRARVVVAAEYPAFKPVVPESLKQPRATEVSAAELYREGWMFHGPAYQGVQEFVAIGDNGIDGVLKVPGGKGALLDNMGQLAGYWVMEKPENCLAMPIGVDRIRFLGPDPVVGEQLRAQVRVTHLDTLNCATDHMLSDAAGQPRILIEGWKTRRYQMDKRFWVSSRKLSHHEVSQPVPPNVALFEDRYDTAILRDYMARRYLAATEMKTYEALAPRRRRQWLSGRVAAKDAVRAYLRQQGLEGVFPKEMLIENSATGAPVLQPNVTGRVPEHLRVSISHKDTLAMAIVSEHPVGIDIERVETRDDSFFAMVFSEAENILLGDEDKAVAGTRGWVVKEVAAKAQGTGLGGRPKDFVIEARDGDCFCVGGHWVVTHRLQDYIVGWSLVPQAVAVQAEVRRLDIANG